MNEIKVSSTGLIVEKNIPEFMEVARRKSGDKRTFKSPKTYQRNQRMYELVKVSGHWTSGASTRKLVIDIDSPLIPPKWDDTITKLRAVYYQLAIEKMSENSDSKPLRLNFNLTPAFTRRAMEKGGLTFIHDRLSKRLTRIGLRIDFWLTIESVIKKNDGSWNRHRGRPHIHGSVLLSPEQEAPFRKAIRTINGKADKTFKLLETRLPPLDNSKGGGRNWAGDYCMKKLGFGRLFIPSSTLVSRTQNVGKLAKKIYEEDRAMIRAIK